MKSERLYWNRWLFGVTVLALLAGLILSIVSSFRLCSEACAESHNWRFFGVPFESLGLLFFIPVNLLFWISKWSGGWSETFTVVVGLLIAGAAGAEMEFILIQKYKIGSWCPVCLSIAACGGIATLCFGIRNVMEIKYWIAQHKEKGELMTTIWKGMAALSLCAFGFFVALIGVAKMDPLAAVEETIKESLVFGNKESPIEIYMFTDWACPACRAVEPKLEKMLPTLLEKVRFTFVDYAIHTQTVNYSPHNVAFMIRNKEQYLKLRTALTELSRKTGTPKESQVEKIAADVGVHYEPLNYSDVALSQKYFKELAKQLGVRGTPSMILVNRESKKGKKLIGISQISEENVLKAIETLEKP
jgi:protein-disulfide isomerase